MADKALTATIQEAHVHGVSTRSVDDLVTALSTSGISKSQVSRLGEEIDDSFKALLGRLLEGDWPYIWIDATHIKTRESGDIVSVVCIVVVGVKSDGSREVRDAKSVFTPESPVLAVIYLSHRHHQPLGSIRVYRIRLSADLSRAD